MEADGCSPGLGTARAQTRRELASEDFPLTSSSSISQGSPKCLAPTNLRSKVPVQPVLSNHTPPTSVSSPASSVSVTPTDRERTSSAAEALLKELFDSPPSRQNIVTLRGRKEGDSSTGNGRKHVRMGLVMESPVKDGQQSSWATGSPKLRGGMRGPTVGDSVPSVAAEGGGAVGRMPRSSPPIAVNPENLENGLRSPRREGHEMDGVVSSPDSGYGNTPDLPLTSMHLGGRAAVATVPPAVLLPRRSRSDAIMGLPSHGMDGGSNSDNLYQVPHSEGLRGTEVAARDSSCSSSGGGIGTTELGRYGGRRQREDTQDSAFSMDSSVSHHHEVSSSPSGLQQLMDDSFNDPLAGRRPMRQAHTCGGRLNTYSAPPSGSHVNSRSAFSSTQSVPRPSSALTQTGSLASSMSVSQGSRKKHRFLYQRNFTKSISDYRSKSMSSTSSGAAATPTHREEKDYFKVTDELSQENAHFAVSEAMLTVLELYRSNTLERTRLRSLLPQVTHSPEVPASCSFPLPIAHVPGISSPNSATPHLSPNLPVPSPLPFTMSSPLRGEKPSPGPELSSWSSMSSIATTEDSYDGPSSSLSLLSLIKATPTSRSAESTAQKLLQHLARTLNGYDVPMPELALHLPTDFMESLQMDEDLRKSVTTSSSHMRGSREWAPPRKQIIYHIKTQTRAMLEVISSQGWRCTGCGMKVEVGVAKTFRFCNYTGKYFCQSCHTNSTHILPAHILGHWSFRKMLVSNFARDMLSRIENEFVFNVSPSHQVYKKVGSMAQVKEVRGQLVSLRQYMRTCRQAMHINQMFDEAGPWTSNMESFSLNDFLEVRAGTKLRYLRSLATEGVAHVKACPLCQGKGFVCEFCQRPEDILFPFETSKVSSCQDCNCCFHKECFKKLSSCPRCTRMKERQRRRVQKIVLEEGTEEGGMDDTIQSQSSWNGGGPGS